MQTDLVKRAMRGDHEAFAQLASDAWPKLYGTAGLILGEDALADEAMQATLIRAWRDLPSLRDPERFDAWLYRLAVNACRDEARRRKRGRQREIALDAVDPPSPVESTAQVADRDELDQAFAYLSVDQRTILTLVFYRDLTLAGAAAAMGIPVGTAKSRLHRAVEALRAALGAERRGSVQREVGT